MSIGDNIEQASRQAAPFIAFWVGEILRQILSKIIDNNLFAFISFYCLPSAPHGTRRKISHHNDVAAPISFRGSLLYIRRNLFPIKDTLLCVWNSDASVEAADWPGSVGLFIEHMVNVQFQLVTEWNLGQIKNGFQWFSKDQQVCDQWKHVGRSFTVKRA